MPNATTSIARAAEANWGRETAQVFHEGPDDSPMLHLVPGSLIELGDILRWAGTEGLSLLPRGGGTKIGWGPAPAVVDGWLSTTRLPAAIDHCAGDLTATLPAGLALDAANRILGEHGQCLPLDPPDRGAATVGGIIATNDSGPRRLRFGAPRDLIIGMEMVLADGRVAKAGGRVVKNVSGYDLARLMCGSLGTLVVVATATFKLAPLPHASRTVVADLSDSAGLAALARAIARAPFQPSAVEIDGPPWRVLVRIESTERATETQADEAAALCRAGGATTEVVAGAEEAVLWDRHGTRPPAGGVLIRISVLPSAVPAVLDAVARCAPGLGRSYRLAGRFTLGVLYMSIDPAPDAGRSDSGRSDPGLSRLVDDLRLAARTHGGAAVVLRGDASLRPAQDWWGEGPTGRSVMRALKARLDPRTTLSRGRGPEAG
jgi:glycolate oxidase FAD binding subunit